MISYRADGRDIEIVEGRILLAKARLYDMPCCCGMQVLGNLTIIRYPEDVDGFYKAMYDGVLKLTKPSRGSFKQTRKLIMSDNVDNIKNPVSIIGFAKYFNALGGSIVTNPFHGDKTSVQLFELDIHQVEK